MSNSDAVKHQEALRSLGRSNPRKSYETLWQENFAAFYEGDDKKAKKKSQPETGKGAVVSDMPTGELPEKFNSWPLEKRQQWFKTKGIDTLPRSV